jgi:hypothetical protein
MDGTGIDPDDVASDLWTRIWRAWCARGGVAYIGSPEGTTDYIEADVRDPDAIVAFAARTLDFSRPIALMMLGVLGQLPDTDQPQAILQHLLTALPPGSYLALSDGLDTTQIADFFTGLDLIDPGVVTTSTWRPDLTTASGVGTADLEGLCGIGRKPN